MTKSIEDCEGTVLPSDCCPGYSLLPPLPPKRIAPIYPMNTRFPTSRRPAPGGFSLVEMLTVIAVIGVIASIAIPSIGSINSSANTATAKRNAQNIVSIYQAGKAAGAAWGATDVATAAAAVQAGRTSTDGTFFGVKGLNATAVSDATPHLSWDAGAGLIYVP
jgi:prepilin-type N-terminal cleavage/methylation domain-containing protein